LATLSRARRGRREYAAALKATLASMSLQAVGIAV
jgi:hypothetical protein